MELNGSHLSLPFGWLKDWNETSSVRHCMYVRLYVCVCVHRCVAGWRWRMCWCRSVDGSSFSHSKSFDVSLNLILFSSASGAGGIDASFIHAVFVCVAMCVRLREAKPACFLHHISFPYTRLLNALFGNACCFSPLELFISRPGRGRQQTNRLRRLLRDREKEVENFSTLLSNHPHPSGIPVHYSSSMK